MWRTRILTCASILALALVPMFASAQSAKEGSNISIDDWSYYSWTFDRFDAVIDVHEDASFTVTEILSVTYNTDKHGIIRSIPVVYRDDFGNRVRITLDVESVRRNGVDEPYRVTRNGPNQDIKIGHAAVYITGEQVYEITYRVNRAMLYFDGFDELYWNVTGDPLRNEVPIEYATAVVMLPDGAEPLQYQCYTGLYGSTEQDCTIDVAGRSVGFAAYDVMTVAVGFTPGVVDKPSIFERILWFLDANKAAALPLGVVGVLFVIWLRHGNDPRMKKTVVAEFEPPAGLWPAYAAFLLKDRVTKWAIASMIIQLAEKGYIRIDVDEASTAMHRGAKLVKLRKSDGLDTAHAELFDGIFKTKTEVLVKDLRGRVTSKQMKTIRNSIREELERGGYYDRISFKWRSALSTLGIILLVILFYVGPIMTPLTIVTFLVAGVSCLVFAVFMPKKTHAGVELMRQVLGFKLFMHTAERYRSKWQEEKGLFATYLPYAIAFQDVAQWAKAFEGMEERPTPSWYRTTLTNYSLAAFATDLSSIGSAIATNAAPQSSGSSGGYSGGGGFSGGGFGGGGTSSW